MPRSYPDNGSKQAGNAAAGEPILRDARKGTSRKRMTPIEIVAANLNALIEHHRKTGGRLTSIYAIEAATAALGEKVGKTTVDRIVKSAEGWNIVNLEPIAKVFKLQPWQLLVPNLVPTLPPVLASGSRAQRLSDEALEIALQLDSIRNPDMREVAVAKAYMAAFRPQKPLPPTDPVES